MPFRLTEMVGCEFPLFAFSHCRDVVAAVSRAGGFGVLGAVSYTPEQLETELRWIDDNIDGKPYGIDVLIPEVQAVDHSVTAEEIVAAIPKEYRDFTRKILRDAGLDESSAIPHGGSQKPNTSLGQELLEVSFKHPVRLIANALGTAPAPMIEAGKRHGIPVAALVGAKEHAMKQIEAGVDIIVAQGGEGGGHCGDVSTVVLIPEVLQAIEEADTQIPVLAAGGIMNGKQIVQAIDIDPSLLSSDEKEILEDLIKAALNQAKEKVEEMSAEEMKKITGGLPLPPGMKMPF